MSGGLVAETDMKVSDGDVSSRQASVEPLGMTRSDDVVQSPVKVVVSDEDEDDSSRQQRVMIDGGHRRSVEKDAPVMRLKDVAGNPQTYV